MNAQTIIEAPRNVYQKLSEARLRFHATELRKSGKNTFAGYSYFELGDFLVPALKIFNEVGLSAHISFSADIATMTIVNVEDIGDRLHIESPMGSAALKGCHEVQNIGAVETYQRRYLWVTALEIVEHDALDSSEPAGERSQKGEVSPRQDTPPERWTEPGSTYSGISKLKAGLKQHMHDLDGCGDSSMVYTLCNTPDWREFCRVCELHAPWYLRGGEPAPPEFEGLLTKAERMVKEFDSAEASQRAAYAGT